MNTDDAQLRVPGFLDRHQQRRQQGLPTLSLLVGPRAVAVEHWQNWASRTGRSIVVSEAADEQTLAVDWLNGLAASGNLVDDALAWLAAQKVEPELRARGRVAAMSLHDFDTLWQELFPDFSRNPAAHIAYRILRATILGVEPPETLEADFLRASKPDPQQTAHALLVGLAELVSDSRWPTLFVAAPAENLPDWLNLATRTLAGIAVAVPPLPIALVATRQELEKFLKAAPDSRLATLLREGRLDVDGSPEKQPPVRLDVPVSAATTATLAKIGATPASQALLTEVAASLASRGDREDEDRARSAAERFLFEVLESWPPTVGKFKLNERLEFLHGSALAEADLVAPTCRLVIELDGSYHHLRDTEAYRRDRKKDYGYQRHGYLVLRFLSEDVVTRLDHILRTIVEALGHQDRMPFKQRLDV